MASAGSVQLSSVLASPTTHTADWPGWSEQELAAEGEMGSAVAVVEPHEGPGVGVAVAEGQNLEELHTAVTEDSVEVEGVMAESPGLAELRVADSIQLVVLAEGVVEGQAGERYVPSRQHIAGTGVVPVQVAGVEEAQETAEEFLAVQLTTERGVLASLAGFGEYFEKQAMVGFGCHSEVLPG
jgi:hypothetical protein